MSRYKRDYWEAKVAAGQTVAVEVEKKISILRVCFLGRVDDIVNVFLKRAGGMPTCITILKHTHRMSRLNLVVRENLELSHSADNGEAHFTGWILRSFNDDVHNNDSDDNNDPDMEGEEGKDGVMEDEEGKDGVMEDDCDAYIQEEVVAVGVVDENDAYMEEQEDEFEDEYEEEEERGDYEDSEPSYIDYSEEEESESEEEEDEEDEETEECEEDSEFNSEDEDD